MQDAEPTTPGWSPAPAVGAPQHSFRSQLGAHLSARIRLTSIALAALYLLCALPGPELWPVMACLAIISLVPAIFPEEFRSSWAQGLVSIQGQLIVIAALVLPSVPLMATAMLACLVHTILHPLPLRSRILSLTAQGVIITVLAVRTPVQVPILLCFLALATQLSKVQLHHWRSMWNDKEALGELKRRLEQDTRLRELAIKERESELLEQQERMVRQEQWATLGRVAAGVGHEIKNPLQAAMADLETARRTQNLNLVTDAQASLERIRGLLDDLSQLRGKDREDVDNYGLREVTQAAVRGALMGIKGLRVTIGALPDVPVRINQARLTQVLANLLTNAWHAVERRGHGEVRIHAALSAQNVWIYVDDDGPGVPEAAQERVFEAFVTTKSAGRGTGLGLPVSRGLMRAMGGDLWLDRGSQLGGARLVLALAYAPSDAPRERVHTVTPPDRALSPTTAVQRSPTPVHTRRALPKGILMIVDDDARVRRSLERMAGEEWTVLAAENSVQARDLATHHRIDVVLCDLHLVREDAVDVLEVLRSVRPGLIQRTVLMSGEPTSARLLALAEANPERLLGKPFNRSTGLALLRDALADRLPYLEVPDVINTPASVAAIEPAWRFDPPTEETVIIRNRDRLRSRIEAIAANLGSDG